MPSSGIIYPTAIIYSTAIVVSPLSSALRSVVCVYLGDGRLVGTCCSSMSASSISDGTENRLYAFDTLQLCNNSYQ